MYIVCSATSCKETTNEFCARKAHFKSRCMQDKTHKKIYMMTIVEFRYVGEPVDITHTNRYYLNLCYVFTFIQ